MTIQYVDNRYIVKETYTIYDKELDKHVCVCTNEQITKHVAMLLNEEPHDKIEKSIYR